jgi:anti-sigma B factor antagonist
MEFYWHEIDRDVLIIRADGGLNAQTATQFVQSIEHLVEQGLRWIIIDCEQLTYISSYGLTILLRMHGWMKNIGGEVVIAAVHGLVPQALHITRLDSVFQIYPDVDRARLHFRTADSDSESGDADAS